MSRYSWDEHNLELFWYWISERQKIFYRRKVLANPPPWTVDVVLQDNHMTNVYRELDPGTTWLLHKVLETMEVSPSDRAFVAFAYRLFGTERVFEILGAHALAYTNNHPLLPGHFDERWLADQLQELMDDGEQAFTPAYMVSNYGRSEPKSQVIASVLHRAAGDWPETWASVRAAKTRKEAYAALTRVYGMGRFVAFQVMVDLCYPLHGLGKPRDSILGFGNNDWVTAGPGALRGLQLILPGAVQKDDDAAIAELVRLQRPALQAHGMPWLLDPKNQEVQVDRSNMQNCLCEYSKYHRLISERREGKGGAGRRRKFSPVESRAHDELTQLDHTPLAERGHSRFALQVDASNR